MAYVFVLVAMVAALIPLHFLTLYRLTKLRSTGLYPKPGQATSEDVSRLLDAGLKAWAIRCHRELHGCSLKDARKAIDVLITNQNRR